MPKVSVIIPVYNSEKYLQECLDSVISQSLQDIEIICVNDGSTDSSLSILKNYEQKDSRIVIINRENKGVSYSRNEAIQQAKGEFICFMDSDDLYPDNRILEELYTKAKENDVLIAGGEFSTFDTNIQPYEFKQKFGSSIDGYLFKDSGIVDYKDYQFDYGFHRFIYNREFLIKNNIFYPNYTRFEDVVFFTRAMHFAKKFYALDKICYGYRIRHKNIKFNKQHSIDLLNAILNMLDFSQKHNYKKLEKYISKRYCEHLEFIKDFSQKDLINKIETNKKIKQTLQRENKQRFFQNIFSMKNEILNGKIKILNILGIEILLRKEAIND